MTAERFRSITSGYAALRIAIVGDFCLDRYLDIDPARCETSIETGLPVHNVVRVRAQPGGAGTILNNLVALGVGRIVPSASAATTARATSCGESLRDCPASSSITS